VKWSKLVSNPFFFFEDIGNFLNCSIRAGSSINSIILEAIRLEALSTNGFRSCSSTQSIQGDGRAERERLLPPLRLSVNLYLDLRFSVLVAMHMIGKRMTQDNDRTHEVLNSRLFQICRFFTSPPCLTWLQKVDLSTDILPFGHDVRALDDC
jgi:hypothetical protein